MAAAAASTAFSAVFLLLIISTTAQPPPDQDGPRDPYAYQRITPSMAIIIVVLIPALFLMGFFSIYIRQCSESNSAIGSIRGLGRSHRAAVPQRHQIENLHDFFNSADRSLPEPIPQKGISFPVFPHLGSPVFQGSSTPLGFPPQGNGSRAVDSGGGGGTG
ncbi:E3 ubiquitin-protein ligase ATL6 [Linum perenne]